MGRAAVAPNPPVGSVLVWKNRIIGEGFHQFCGKAHAEVNAINSVSKKCREKISASTLYVSLEPCNHQGRTPPCTQLILNNGIPRVVIGSRDPFITDNGGGMAFLKSQGVQVDLIDLYPTSELANFNESVSMRRPRIILKYAVSKNG
ncbi:MAG TPA: bifunctional diaminohydroxyphosphoribosylaminopyrimidine deaminase/5-amino-6-(5-phosphoribosylamino)uracil reductase RibD, partial [Saprospiraceae bacterium]|nr:bifunctional diaminohydroxyphosphoribosylaminopyrimidine deaminase/5-amino-6-(5-phosphoribosylamino)uracil reductase RibD [Saprospiraceae bacterium]